MAQHDRPRKMMLFLLIFSLLALTPLAAEAVDGTITGVTAVPSPATTGAAVTITVTGQDGPCGSLDLDFGDGTPHQILSGAFALSTQHIYTTTGIKTITASKVQKCKGVSSAALVVNAPSTGTGVTYQLCQKVDCGGALSGPATIAQVVPFISNITSWGWVSIKGSWLGNDEGELWLKGLKKWTGASVGDVKLLIPSEPGKDYWKPTSVFGWIPPIVGVKDQPAKLQIKTKAGKWSNEFPVNFTAMKDLKHLPSFDVEFSCSEESDWDACNHVLHTDWGGFCSAPFVSGGGGTTGTFSGYHWTCVGSSNGTDSFWASLLNGWIFENAVLTNDSTSPTLNPPSNSVVLSGFQAGTTSTNVKLKWNNADTTYVLYRVDVSIVGPIGVPYK
jgi:hypothetical protein